MSATEEIIAALALQLEKLEEPPGENQLKALVDAQALVYSMTATAPSDLEKETILKEVKARFDHRMGLGAIFDSEDYRPWLNERRSEIDPFYWTRYKQLLLTEKSFPLRVVRSLDRITDRVLDRIEDPSKQGVWNRRGLVVGHVQSGKTANFAGLINKSADAGYQVIIVLAGMLNSLRSQTQERLESDFIGYCSKLKGMVGVGNFDTRSETKRPVCFTSVDEDFKKPNARNNAMNLGVLRVPIVFVVKKNKSTLTTLKDWLVQHNRHNLRGCSMLMIDDEADHASVNTAKEDRDPTAINLAIRDLLSIFDRSSYVGYTATPFANIFIDPENVDEMTSGEVYGDLFPRHFILSLDPPNNYIGPDRIFGDESELNYIREITDYEDLLPLKHKKNEPPPALPNSLLEAIDCFILAKSIRLLRCQENKSHSMMVNASRFTNVQEEIRDLMLDYLRHTQEAINLYAALNESRALQNSVIARIKSVWEFEYSNVAPVWEEVQLQLREAAGNLEIICVNSRSSDQLDYSKRDYPNGRSVIAVGGLGLSRGLTLDGLLVSYFLRNTVMYDTLMQMGRWFGYRDGYEDVCRIYMTPEASSWYAHVADATAELRDDFRQMEKANMTPMEFGLKVRSHPSALIVTARNKMRAATSVPVRISLEGRLAETSVLLAKPEILKENRHALESLVSDIQNTTPTEDDPKGLLWRRIPMEKVMHAIESFQNHPECMLTDPRPLISYLDKLRLRGCETCDVLLRSVKGNPTVPFAGVEVGIAKRTVPQLSSQRIEFTKRRVASRGDESAALLKREIAEVVASTDKGPTDRDFRIFKGKHNLPPLFMIHAVRCEEKGGSDKSVDVVAFGLSLPGDSSTVSKEENMVEYQVNPIWWKTNYGSLIADEEEDD